MLTAHGALRPNSEAPRSTLAGAGRGTTNFINISNDDDNSEGAAAQLRVAYVPPIIALHWLRPEAMEAAHG